MKEPYVYRAIVCEYILVQRPCTCFSHRVCTWPWVAIRKVPFASLGKTILVSCEPILPALLQTFAIQSPPTITVTPLTLSTKQHLSTTMSTLWRSQFHRVEQSYQHGHGFKTGFRCCDSVSDRPLWLFFGPHSHLPTYLACTANASTTPCIDC